VKYLVDNEIKRLEKKPFAYENINQNGTVRQPFQNVSYANPSVE